MRGAGKESSLIPPAPRPERRHAVEQVLGEGVQSVLREPVQSTSPSLSTLARACRSCELQWSGLGSEAELCASRGKCGGAGCSGCRGEPVFCNTPIMCLQTPQGCSRWACRFYNTVTDCFDHMFEQQACNECRRHYASSTKRGITHYTSTPGCNVSPYGTAIMCQQGNTTPITRQDVHR